MAAEDRAEPLADPARTLERGTPMRRWQMACTGAVALALLLALVAPAAAQETEPAAGPVSMEGTLVGAQWPDVTAPACDLPGTAWRFKIVASGELAGLGEVEAYMTHCTLYDPESATPPTYYDAMTTFRTAEGDLLAVVHDIPTTEVFVGDDGQPAGFRLDGTWQAVGGTGRFMHAAGTGTVKGAADIPGDITLDYTGEITLDAPEAPAA
jgi:hypothetical protein